jgi:hypothetical protein
MPTLPIPFSPLNKSADKPSMSEFNQDMHDGYWQEYISPDGPKMIWAKRPGLTTFLDLSQAQRIDGLHYWIRQQKLIAVCNQKIFRITSVPAATDVTGTATMTALVRPTFADVLGTNLYAANSGQIAQIPAASTAAFLTDADAPTSVRFIAPINRKLVALEDVSEIFDWSEPGDPTDWTGQVATLENQPDLGLSMFSAAGYLWFHGQSSIEVWRDDGTTFIREGQGAIQRGSLSKYSVSEINGSFYWLDSNREICKLTGFTIQSLSNPNLSRYLKSFSTVSDAQGDYLKIEGRHFYILSFPTEGKTLVYDIGLNMWYEWGYWNAGTAEYEAWKGNCVTDATDWNKTLAGDRSSSVIWEVGGTTDDGDTIRTVITTDGVDRGRPEVNKFCHELLLQFKRADTSTTPKTMTIKWRDDGSTTWNTEITENIEAQSATDLIVRSRRLGKYRQRHWQFIMTDATQSALIGAWETFTFGK